MNWIELNWFGLVHTRKQIWKPTEWESNENNSTLTLFTEAKTILLFFFFPQVLRLLHNINNVHVQQMFVPLICNVMECMRKTCESEKKTTIHNDTLTQWLNQLLASTNRPILQMTKLQPKIKFISFVICFSYYRKNIQHRTKTVSFYLTAIPFYYLTYRWG